MVTMVWHYFGYGWSMIYLDNNYSVWFSVYWDSFQGVEMFGIIASTYNWRGHGGETCIWEGGGAKHISTQFSDL